MLTFGGFLMKNDSATSCQIIYNELDIAIYFFCTFSDDENNYRPNTSVRCSSKN
jgi:hypothetical protein